MKYPILTLLLVLLVGCAPRNTAYVGKVFQAGDTDDGFVRFTFVDADTCEVRIYMREVTHGALTAPKDTRTAYPYVIAGKYIKMTRDGKIDLYEIKGETLADPLGGVFTINPSPRDPKPAQAHLNLNIP